MNPLLQTLSTNKGTILLIVAIDGFLIFQRFGKVDSQKAQELVEAGATLLDVSSAAEFQAGHLEGALRPDAIERRADELGDKAARRRLSERGPSTAVNALKRAGFTAVHDLGSIARW